MKLIKYWTNLCKRIRYRIPNIQFYRNGNGTQIYSHMPICENWRHYIKLYYYYKVPGPTHPFGFTTLQQSVTISTSWTRLKFIEIHWKDIDRNRGLSKSFQEILCRFCLLFTICGALLFRSLGNSPQLVIQRFSMLKRDTFAEI